ncbi:MAG: 2-hydroxyglutaryl-CoA dehydratase, partial [Firmicutes bacterium]|nr:2-hydroxyglutaryl-CoA dehydratase [Bacillota bacterium]
IQGGVSKNSGVVRAFEDVLGCKVTVDPNGHHMGAIGAAILARSDEKRADFSFEIENTEFKVREASCGRCPNNCEILCVYKDGKIIDAWGNRCERGAVSVG